MEQVAQRYFELKALQKEMEEELSVIRQQLIDYCANEGVSVCEVGDYRVKIVAQERREYDDQKVYEALPDPAVWRLLSKTDASKVAALTKLGVVSEASLLNTYTPKKISSLFVERL